MKFVQEIQDLKEKKVLLRVDFDVPVENGKIQENFRIEKQKEMLDYLVEKGAKVVMMAHISASESFSDLIPQLHILLGHEIGFIKKIEDIAGYLEHYSGPALLENIRNFPGEVENSEEFARNLANPSTSSRQGGFDLYVNNAFAVCHRNHASVSAITKILPSYAGLLIQKEVAELEKVIRAPKEGKIVVMGGAKAATKIPAIKNLLDKSEVILIGGVIANDALKLRGYNIQDSVVDENPAELFEGIDLYDARLQFPEDFAMGENKILDIGRNTIKAYQEFIEKASMTIWNGPMGLYEDPQFTIGTNQIALAIVENDKAYKVLGGGDTIAAVNKMNLLNRFNTSTSLGTSFVSTGGGAMLDFLAGKELPGLVALGYGK